MLTRSLPVVAVMLALLVSAGVAYAQGPPTVPTIESVAVTSDPGEDGGYAIGDEIQVGLTFSEAVTVTGAPQLTLDVGGRRRTAEYSEGATTTQLLFAYTVSSGDEDTDGIAVVADSLALNGGAIRAGATNATLTHAALQANDHKVDGIAPTVTVGGETRTYVPPGRQFNVVFYFSEKVYGITDPEITVTNGAAHDVRATGGNDTWPRYTRWDVIIVPAAEGPVTVTLAAGAGADAYGNENTAPGSALSVIAADPVMVEVTRTTSGFAEGGKAAFIVTRSRDNGAIPVSLSLDQTGDFLSGTAEVYPPPDPDMPENAVTPTEVEFAETPFTLNVTFAAGETSKRISVLTEDDTKDEDDGTVTLSVPTKADQYQYIPGNTASVTADVRDNDEPSVISLYWQPPFNAYDPNFAALDTVLEGGAISLGVFGFATGEPLLVTLAVAEEGTSYLDLDGEGARGYEDLGNGKLRVTLPLNRFIEVVSIPLLENSVKEADGSVTITIEPDPGRSYIPSVDRGMLTIPVKDNDSPSTVSISGGSDVTEGAQLSYTLTRTWAPGQDQGQLIVNVQLAETGDYITWPTDYQPDANDMVTIPVAIAKGSLTGTLTLDTVDDAVSENAGSVTATILADTNGSYVAGTSSALTTTLLDNDPPTISVEAVAAVVTEGANAQYRITRSGSTSASLRVGLYVTGLPKIMTDATETIVLTSDNEDQSKRLTINGAWVDYILEFAAGETEKTLPLTTEADSINEGDGWLAVSILQRTGVPYNIGTGRAQVHVKDDDIPTVSLNRPVGPTGLTLSSDGTTWEGKIVEGTQFTYNSACTGVTEFSHDATVSLDPVSMWVQYSNHPAFYGEQHQDGVLGYNRAAIHHLGTDCSSQTVTYSDHRFYVGPDNGVLTIEIVPRSELEKQGGGSSYYRPGLFVELARQYEAAAAEAQAAGTLITKTNIFHTLNLRGYNPHFSCSESDLRYCPQYRVGTVKKIRLTVTNRDPTVLIEAESTSVTEGQPARFILERRWATDLLALPPPQSQTVVYLRASQDGQYITGALPTQITFGQNETRKVIELQTVDDSASGDNGSVTIELLPDTSAVSENLHGKYTIWENWVGHTPAGGRSDKATVTITNDDDKPGITIAPASATEGDSGNTNVTFTLTLGQAVSGAVAVSYATSDGTATAGQDYTAVTSGTATIPADSTSATFTVSVSGDTTDEANETFNVTISLPEPEPDLSDGSGSTAPEAAIVGGATATVSGTIVDDDPVVVTVAPKADSVVEGQDAVFVLTRTGYTDDALSMQVRLSAPGKVEILSAEFEAGATTTELSAETEDNDLVDYPSALDYTIEVPGDGDINGGDDEIYTPGDPSQATVSVTDNDKLQIITVHPHEAFVREGGEVKYVFRRTGDVSEELWFTYAREARQAETTSFEDYNFVNERFPAGLSEITTGALVNGVVFPSDEVVNRLYPYKFTAQVYGDGQRYGLHRIWKAGTPDTATIAYYDDDRTRDTVLRAQYPGLGQVGQTIHIDFEVLSSGSEATGSSITVSSVQRAVGDRNQTMPAEPRVRCSISGSLATGEIGTCRATFTLTEQDLTDSPMVLDATASDGTTTSSTQRIYITVLGGVAVGFSETTRLSVREPAYGAANTQAVLEVTRVGESDQQVQVAYTVEPMRTTLRPYPPEAGADYVDNSATPGILTFAANETKKNITIDILGDEIDEPTGLLRVTLVPPRGVRVEAAKRSRVVAIVDRAPPSGQSYLPTASLELVSADPTPESAGSVDFAVVLDRVWGEDARFEVELDAHANLTATPAFSRLRQTGDFEAPDGLIHATIPAGQTRFEFSLTLYDDDVREEDETFRMQMGSSITQYLSLIGDEDEVLVTIADDDLVEPTGVELALTRNNGVFDSVAENSSPRNITVTASFSDIRWPTDAADAALRPADPRDVDTTVRVEFDSATSTAAQTDIERFRVADSQGAFQNVESFDIVIPAGQTSGTTTLRFKPANDDVDEEDETVTLQGTEVVAADSNEFLPVSSASFTITDDDTRGITVSTLLIGMMEGATSTYALVLDTQPTDTVTVTVATTQDNLIKLTPETLTFTPSDWSTAQTISVVSLDDGTDASFTEDFLKHGVSGGDYGSVSVGDIWVLIENTTQAYIYLDDAQASESDGYVEFTVSVRPILRTVPVVVRYTTVDGTAAAGTDYTRQVNTGQTYKIFSIRANEGAATIRIPITDNEVYGPAEKTFTLQLTNENNKALLDGGATSLTATGSIIDDDPKPVVSVAGPAGDLSYISEDLKGPVTFTLTLTGRSAADVSVDYATGEAQVLNRLATRQGITPATAGEDYTAATGTVTFSPGDATKQVTVQLTDDDVSEDTEFFGFKISNVQNAQLRNEAAKEVADVGLLDDDRRGVAIDPTSISLEEPAPGETAVASSYTVTLNSKPTDTVTVTIGGASPAVSLSGATLSNTNTLTFTTSSWDTAQTVTVTPVEDANGTGETITLTHIQSGGDYTGIAADSVTVNVTDSDIRNVVLSPTSLTVEEGDETGVSYTVKLSTQPSDTVTVTIGGPGGTDLSISGATLSNSNTLTFSTSNWNTAQTVTVKAGHDGNSDDESQTLTHSASGGDYANLTKDLPVTITDDDDPQVTVSFGAASYLVPEGSSRTVTVTLDTDPERTVVIPIEAANEGGASDSDYSGVPESVTFDAGQTSRTFDITAVEDNLAESGERVRLSFGALPADASLGTRREAAVSIIDRTQGQDLPTSPTVHFESAAYSVDEGATVAVKVRLSKAPGSETVIPITAANRAAASDDDYSGVPDSVTFAATETEQTITFAATDDSVDDDGEQVNLSFGSLPGGITATTGEAAETVVSITDDDRPTALTVAFGQAAYSVAEGSTVTVKVTLSDDPETDLTIPISKTNKGGATSADYSGVPASVTFGSGDTEQSFVFTAGSDAVDDDGESVKLAFGALPTTPLTVTAGTTDEATVTIGDDDVPSVTVSFGRSSYSVAESDDPGTLGVTENTVEVTVTLSADPERTVVIPIAKSIQDGASTADYWGVPASVTFNSGDTSKSFVFTAAHDTVDDDGERVQLSIGGTLPDGVSAEPPAVSIITITDDDDPQVTVAFGSATYTVAESDDPGTPGVTENTVEVTVTLSADPERTVVIPIAKTNQDGASTADYSGVPQHVTFNSGDRSKSFVFTAAHDTADDDGEGVKLSFGATPPDGVSAGTPATSTVTITDDDDPQVTVSFGAASYLVPEGSSRTVTVTLDADPERTVVIPIEAANEGGASDSDYSGVPESVTFDAGQTSRTFDITAVEDNLAESGERVRLSFGALPTDASLGTHDEAAVSIIDRTQGQDLPTSPTVHFESVAYSVDEGATVAVKVRLSKAPGSETVIPLTVANGAGASDDDYSGVPDSITFAATETEQTIAFAATDDSVDDDGEQVNLSFGSLPGGITATTGEAAETVVSITDDDRPTALTVAFGQAAYSVAEGSTVTVKVTLSDDPETDLTIPISKTNKGGATSADYSGVPASVTFGSGDTEQSFVFTAGSDAVDDDGESVKLAFGALPTTPLTVTAGTTDEATVTIGDDDVPSVTVSFGAASYLVPEGSSRTVTVTLDADPERTVVIPIEAANEGGASDSDYSGVPESVTFDAGQTSRTFDITAVEDNLAESGERVRLSFGALPTDASLGTHDEAAVSIIDRTQGQDLPTSPTVHFESVAYSVDEGATVAVKVRLSKAPGSETVIPLTVANGAGASDDDYSGVPDSITFAATETEQTIAFAATDDSVDDDGEQVNLSFGSLPGGITATTGEAAETVVSITDDDRPTALTVAFGQAAYSVAEGSTVTVKVTLSDDPETDLTIPISKTNKGGATSADYSGVPASVTFGSGDTEQSFVFTAGSDAVDDDGESVKLAFGALPTTPLTVTAGTTDEATVTIGDDDVPSVTVSFGRSSYSVAESDDPGTLGVTENTVEVTVTLSADPERTVVIPIAKSIQDGASTADYWGVPASVTFNSGDTSKSFVFTAAHDTVDDDGERVQLSIGGTLPDGVSAEPPAVSIITITDDDDPAVTVSFGAASYTVTEGSTVSVEVKLDQDPERTVAIPITATPGGGAEAADYSGVPENVTFAAGETSKTITFAATDDSADDDGETVALGLGTPPTGVQAGTPATTTVTITDNDDPQVTVSFGASSYTVTEGSTVSVEVKLDQDPERTVAIPITSTPGGGAEAADYSGVPENVTFAAGETSKTITFTATDDSADDDGETVALGFGTRPTGVTAGTTSTTTVTITDNDDPAVTVSFGAASYTVAEGSTVSVEVKLNQDPERTVVIPITATPGDGAEAADYSGVPANVTFASGETSKTITFAATDDTADDDGETVALGFGTRPTGVTAGTTSTTTVTITDNDDPAVTVSFGAASYTVAEGSTVSVEVKLNQDPERTVVIPITSTPGGGAEAADYSGVPENVTFAAGETSKTFTFTATDDSADDDGETVALGFGTPPSGVTAGTISTTTVTITDDDDPAVTVSFGAASHSVTEGSSRTVTVTLDADPERTVVIPIEKTNEGGATTADYSGVPQNVTFDSGETLTSFVFTAETDTDDDHGESVRLSFNTMPDARVSKGSPSEAMVTIRQDSSQSTADCNSAVWCADLEFKSESAPGEMWFLGSKFLDSQFHYGGVTYRFRHISVAPYGHNIPIGGQPRPPFAIPERTKLYFSLENMNASGYDLDRFRVPNDDWMDWTLHVSTTKNGETLIAVLPLSEARFRGNWSEWRWYGSDLEALRAAWAEGQVYKLKIIEDPRSQRTPKVLGPPLYLKVTPYTNHTLGAWWKMPENRVDRAPPNTTYKVQWKEASDSWDNPADVSEETDSPSPATNESLFHSIRGLTGGVEYHVRVIATNTVGDSEPSEVVSGTPTPLPAAGQNIAANSLAKGAPSIEGTPEVGQTLSAVTTDITDDDGLQDVVFSYQWLADDVEISGADGATYILTSDDLGKAINVRVGFTDNAGNEESLTSAPTAAVTAAEDLELQSATVDGSTLTLTYNETLDTGVTLPASAFVVNVNEASRSIMGVGVGGSSVLLLLSSAVETGDTVTVDYTAPDGQDFIRDSQGRKAESFSGQAVTNNSALAETERSDPAQTPGSPTSLKVSGHGSGQFLASWAAPDSGSDPTGYTLQWKESGDDWDDANDVSEANVNGTSHVITGLTGGVQYAVRVIAYKDDSESAPSGEVTATPRETTPPSPSSVSVNGATLTITFDEPLDTGETPGKSAFAVTVAGSSRGVDTVSVSGSRVTLTLVTPVLAGEAVTVAYTVPTGATADRLRDLAGNAAASFSGREATNATQAADQLTASVSVLPESHDGGTVFTFELRFSETPRKGFSYKIMRDLAFTVTGGEVIKARRLAPPSNVGWEIHVRPDGNGLVTIVLPVTTDCTAEGAICTEDRRPLSNRLEITVPAPDG